MADEIEEIEEIDRVDGFGDDAATALDRLRAGDARGSRHRAHLEGRKGWLVDELRRRVAASSYHHWRAVGAVAIVLAIGVGVAFGSHSVFAEPGDATLPTTTTIPMVSSLTSTTSGATIVVHVAGAVRSPGVYRVAPGSRLVDLLDRAGGPGEGLDLDRVNLASIVDDGARVWFPIVGREMPGLVIDRLDAPSPVGTGRIDLNRATPAQLEELPGVGPATAAAIVAHRTTQGPFRSVDDLLMVKGLGPSKVDAIRQLVSVG